MLVGFLHMFYATPGDMTSRLESIEKSVDIDYIQTGMFDSKVVLRYNSVKSLPDFGVSMSGDQHLEPHYMVVPRNAEVVVDTIPQRRGGSKHVVDGRLNSVGNVLFCPSSIYKNEALISGHLGTPLKDEVSLRLFRLFYKHFLRQFVKVGVSFVGPEAMQLLRDGFRLTQSVRGIGQLRLDRVSPAPEVIEGVSRENPFESDRAEP